MVRTRTRVDLPRLAAALRGELGDGAPCVVWTHEGDEVLVHLDCLVARNSDGLLVVQVDVEADGFAREPVEVRFAVGCGEDHRWVAAAERTAAGLGPVAARWFPILQDAIWASMVDIGRRRSGGKSGFSEARDELLRTAVRREAKTP